MIKRRPYELDTDWESLVAALVEAWTPSGPQTIWHIGDVSWWVRQAWETVPFVWEDDTGQLVGFADYDRQGEFELLVAPRHPLSAGWTRATAWGNSNRSAPIRTSAGGVWVRRLSWNACGGCGHGGPSTAT